NGADLRAPADETLLALLFELLTDASALEVGEIVDEELAVQMIDFVLNTDSKQPVGIELNRLAFAIERTDANPLGAPDLVVYPRHRQAPLLHLLDAFSREDFRIDQHERLIARLADIDDDNALVHVDLRRRQPNTRRGVHGLEHVVDQLLQARIDLLDGLGLDAKPWVWVFENRESCHGAIENGSARGVQSVEANCVESTPSRGAPRTGL